MKALPAQDLETGCITQVVHGDGLGILLSVPHSEDRV